MAILCVGLLFGCEKSGSFHSTDITGADFAHLAALQALHDAAGRRFVSTDYPGQVVVVSFGYTHCPDICPTTLTALRETMVLLGREASRVQVLFVTIDPERDTADVLQSYVPWFDARFRGLRGDATMTAAVARDFRVFYSQVQGSSASGYSMDHSALSYAYDPQGRLRLLIRHGETPQNIAEDLKILLR